MKTHPKKIIGLTLLPAALMLSVSLIQPAEAGTFIGAGSLITARGYHTATLLPNGEVLVVGGNNGSFFSSSELYDPGVGAWSATGPLNNERWFHTATLLFSGEVLVTGGDSTSGNFPSPAELYDPAAGTWALSGKLNTPRVWHTATLLRDGKVLVAGGLGANYFPFPSSAELYDPATGEWTVTGALNIPRVYHSATLLPDGKVLVAGGLDSTFSTLSSTEIYDPASAKWGVSGELTTQRVWHTATLLPNGKVLVAGGLYFIGGTYVLPSNAELFDPATGSSTVDGALNTARNYHTATLLPSGKVLVAGGVTNTGAGYLSSAELYDPASGSWTVDGMLNTAREYHTATLQTDGRVLIAGGANNSGFLSSAELYVSVPGPIAPTLTDSKLLANGSFQFAFTNSPRALFAVLTATDSALPLTNWTVLGSVIEVSPGHFQFTDPQAATSGQRFYRVRSQ